MSPEQQASHEAAYGRVCESYQAIDDFRMKLLGLLPVATGTGVFLLLNDNVPVLGTKASQGQSESLASLLAAIGAFGTVFTLGLFSYELFGIKKMSLPDPSGAAARGPPWYPRTIPQSAAQFDGPCQ